MRDRLTVDHSHTANQATSSPNMARKVKPMKTRLAMKKLMSAIAVTGFFNSGASGLSAFSKTPNTTPVMKIGYLETVFQKFCMT